MWNDIVNFYHEGIKKLERDVVIPDEVPNPDPKFGVEYDGRHAVRSRLDRKCTSIEEISEAHRREMVYTADIWCRDNNPTRVGEGVWKLFDYGNQLGYAWEFKKL